MWSITGELRYYHNIAEGIYLSHEKSLVSMFVYHSIGLLFYEKLDFKAITIHVHLLELVDRLTKCL